MSSESDFFSEALLELAKKLIEVTPERAEDPEILARRAAGLARSLVRERRSFFENPKGSGNAKDCLNTSDWRGLYKD